MTIKFKDHEIAAIVNKVTGVAEKYKDTQQLRTAISNVLVAVLKTGVINEPHDERSA